MSLIKTIKAFISGKKEELKHEAQMTSAYWEGMLAENEKKVQTCAQKHREALGKLNARKEELSNLNKTVADFKYGAKRYAEKYSRTNDKADLTMSKNAFTYAKQIQASIDILQSEIDVLTVAEEQLRLVKENAQIIVGNAKIEIQKKKARVEFSKVVEELTDGIQDICTLKPEGAEHVDEKYFINVEALKDLSAGVELGKMSEVSDDEEYENFIRGE